MKNRFDRLTDNAVRQELHQALKELEKRDIKAFDEVTAAPTTIKESFADMETHLLATAEYQWPIDCLQRRLDGYWSGEMYVIAGTTGIGKSLFTAYLTMEHILNGGCALYFSTEMKNREITRRLWTMWRNYLGDKDSFLDLNIEYGDDKTSVTPQLIELLLEQNDKLAKEGMAKKYTCVVVDNLHWFMRGGATVADDIGIVTKRMKELSMKYNVFIILVSHVNREAGRLKENETPPMNYLKGSSYIEQDSDAVIMITRKKDENGKSTNFSLISLTKNRRNGRTFENYELEVDKNLCFKQARIER